MKKIKSILVIVIIIISQSCIDDYGTIKVQNKISKATITDVKWGEHYIGYNLLPGETSSEYNVEEEMPISNKVSFRMEANGSSIYLETKQVYTLNDGDKLLIELTDSTAVSNPNN